MDSPTIYLVPHTHWDREWYEPFQRFRLRLVDLLDDVVPRAEAEPSFHFTLDGQLAAVDDYLEVRPEATERIAALVHSGQLAIGPWAILLDEFLCSGENIVRNLGWGLARARALGGAMPIGYLPDMFGHCAQMPQILAGAGLRQACVWRGVPAAVTHHAFAWRAPDGTTLRTEYLPGGYGNAAEMIDDPAGLSTAAGEHLDRMRPWYGTDPVLAMYGTDHSAPLPWLTSAVEAMAGNVHLRLSTLAEYLAGYDPADLAGLLVWSGELRSHARANILPGVLSNRPHLKRALSAAERMVERYAEPLTALWAPPSLWPARLLDMAWQRLVQSSCHDSVTGCGVDETAFQVAARIAEAEQIGRGVRDRTVTGLAPQGPVDGAVVVNPTPGRRTSVVLVDVVAPRDWPSVALRLPGGETVATQEVSTVDPAPPPVTRPAADVAAGLRKGSLGLDFVGLPVQDVRLGDHELTVAVGRVGGRYTPEHRALADQVEAVGGDWLLRVLVESRRTFYAAVPAPALGWIAVRPVPAAATVDGPVVVADGRLSNGLVEVVPADGGTLTLVAADGTRLDGVGRIVDGGDVGDLYNYGPPPGDVPVDSPSTVDITWVHGGPLVGSVTVTRGYPFGEVVMAVELRAGEPFCRLSVEFVNRRPDHRVRLHVPVARPATHSYAEGQFAVVQRGLSNEGGHGEVPIPTFPAYSFVDAGGAAVLLSQVSEYELVDGRELAITLLRATGMISRPDHPLRAEPAGPTIATPDAQCLGTVRAELAVMPHADGWEAAGVAAAAEEFRCPFLAISGNNPAASAGSPASGPGGAAGPVAGHAEGLTVSGATMTSLRRRDAEWLELRVVALTDQPTTAVVGPVAAARHADLLGNPGAELSVVDGQVSVPLRAWQLATLQLRRP
jgi:alpha-mannosidase